MVDQEKSVLFPVCAVMRAQARKLADVVSLDDTFMSFSSESKERLESKQIDAPKPPVSIDGGLLDCILTRSQLIAAQKADASLLKCFEEVKNTSD